MTCYIAPPVETVYILLADSPTVIVTPGNVPILLGTYKSTVGQIGAPGNTGQVDVPDGTGQIGAPQGYGQIDVPANTGQIDAPKEIADGAC